MIKNFRGASAIALASIWSLPAIAQTAPAAKVPDAQAADGGNAVDEIIVTAQRRSESLSKVPASVEVVSGQKLSALNINNLTNLQSISPSLIVTTTSNPSNGSFTLRGVGTPSGFEQAVGVYIDGVYRGQPGSALRDLIDIERVEVLRGPQSTLFGRNNAAGAINITTKLPDSGALHMYAEAGYGNYDAVEAKLSVNVPIVRNRLALRVALSESYRHGFVRAPNLPQGDVNSKDRQSVRAQLYWTPTDTTRVRLIGDYAKGNDRCCSYLPLFVSTADATPPGLFFGFTAPTLATPGTSSSSGQAGTYYRPFDRVSQQDNPTLEKAKDRGVSLEVGQDFDGLTLTAIGAYRKFVSKVDVDIDGLNAAFVNIQSRPSQAVTEKSAEVRLQNQTGSKFEWLIGSYYYDQRNVTTSYLPITVKPPYANTYYPLQPFGLPYFTFNADGSVIISQFDSIGIGTTKSSAVFGQATYNLTETVRVTGGLRYLNEKKNGVTTARGLADFAGSGSLKSDALMGTAVVAWQPSSAANLYLRYSRGYKSGGVNLLLTVPTTIASPLVRPEKSDAYEAGAKIRLIGNKLSANVAAYTQTYKDQQVQAFSGAVFTTLNAARVRSRGVEAELLFRPIKRITFNVGLNYLDAKYLSFANAPLPAGCPASSTAATCPAAGLAAGTTSGIQDLTGRTSPNAPHWTFIGGASVDQPISDAFRVRGTVNVRHASSYYTDLALTPAFRNGTTNFIDASIELVHRSGLSFQLWGRNLTKQNAYLSGLATPGGNGSLTAYVNDPRTYGGKIKFEF